MTVDVNAEYVSVTEAARLLGVSPSTIWRWIERGDLPATRIGRRRVKVPRSQLGSVLRPARPQSAEDGVSLFEQLKAGRKLTPEERDAALAGLERAKEFRERVLAERGGVPFPDSWRLIREMREERTRQLDPAAPPFD